MCDEKTSGWMVTFLQMASTIAHKSKWYKLKGVKNYKGCIREGKWGGRFQQPTRNDGILPNLQIKGMLQNNLSYST